MIKNIQVETSGKQKEFNYGFALLRALMCFEVVLNHYWPEKVTPPRLSISPICMALYLVC